MAVVKTMDIDVIVKKAANPKGVSFELKTGNNPPGQDVEFKNEGHPGVLVYFTIDDSKDSTGLQFKPTPGNALWVNSQGSACPTKQSVWNGFVPLSVEQRAGKNLRLLAYCRNVVQKKFAFTLWFLWPDGKEVDYDPIGDGLNGPRGSF